MISLVPLEGQIENLMGFLSKGGVSVEPIQDSEALFGGYQEALKKLQNRETKGEFQKLNVISGVKESKEFCELLTSDALGLLDDKNQSSVLDVENDPEAYQKVELVVSAAECLKVLSGDHGVLFDFIITDVFLMPSKSARGGSTSSAIGVVWANPKVKYRIPDVVEFLVHEMTHHAMFIDEYNHGHYDYDLILEKNSWARSAILKVARPLDKVIHSIVVAVEVLMFRERCIGHPESPFVHPPTPEMVEQVVASLESVESVIRAEERAGKEPVSLRVKGLLEGVRNVMDESCFSKYRVK